MTVFERILLATDGSKHARRALEYAGDLALRDRALVIVVHAFEPAPRYLGRLIANRAKEKLEDAGVDVETEVLQGPPAEAIMRVAKARQVDVIVMRTRGHGDMASLLLGSVSHRVLAHSRVSVMIVRAK
jgi:nucleotide-binding universal stress UspA family protein